MVQIGVPTSLLFWFNGFYLDWQLKEYSGPGLAAQRL
jgi:hypothetical protein